MASYSIKDLEQLSGIKAHTLRIWEKRYNLVEPKRTDTNIRYYDDSDLKRVLNIAILNKKGLKISYLAQLDEEEISSKVNAISSEDRDQHTTIDNLVISMVELDERKFEKLLSLSIMNDGFETTLVNVIHPLFEKVALLWLTGAINPAQEHFISNLVRQKLIVAIDSIMETPGSGSKHFVLYLPEGELHELGLLFKYYLLKKRGHHVTYLGQSVPFEDLDSVVQTRPTDYMITLFYSSITGIDINEYLNKMANKFPEQEILFTAFKGAEIEKSFPENVTHISNSTEFQIFLNDLETVN